MGYYNYLCELLRPLRVYRLDEGSLSGAELYAAGEGLDAAAEALEKAVREGVLMTAEDEGFPRRERLFSRVGARTTPALRRLAIASLLRVGGDGFTLEAVNQTISGCGVRAVAAETDEQGVVRVTFPQVAGEPEDFARIRDIILEIMPCHLQVDFYFRFLTWEECEAAAWTWQGIEDAGHTWESFEKGGADGMTEQEVSVRLTENDERLYACAKRLEAVERRQDALDKLVTAVEVLAVRQESVEGNVKEIRNAVQSITEKPGKRWEALADRVLYLLLGAVFSLLAQGAAA